jgi:hypothetical protein
MKRKSSRFLAKLNPEATPRSVVRSVFLSCLGAAAVWFLLILFPDNPMWKPNLPMFLLWEVCAGLAGAVIEWQVPGETGGSKESNDL